MRYNKLVRDNIPEHIRKNGGTPVTHSAGDAEYWQKLKEKLMEETGEFMKEESIEKLADILEVVEAICEHRKFDLSELHQVQKEKAEKRGKFKKRVILGEA